MGRVIAGIGFMLLLVVTQGPAAGQEGAGSTKPKSPVSPEDAAARMQGKRERSDSPGSSAREAPDTLAPDGTCELISDPETQALCWDARRAYFGYYVQGIAHRTDVFRWQHFSTRMIFFVVLLLVGFGIYFAWVQFHRDDGGEEAQTELEIGSGGLKVSSSVLGVIILVISLGFFSLYLIHVFPIREIL